MRSDDEYLLIGLTCALLAAPVTYVVMRRTEPNESLLKISAFSGIVGMLVGAMWPIAAIIAIFGIVAFVVGSLYEGLQWFRMWLANKLGVKDDE